MEARTGLSRSTIHPMMSRGEFPKPLRLGARTVGWPEAAIGEWLNSRNRPCLDPMREHGTQSALRPQGRTPEGCPATAAATPVRGSDRKAAPHQETADDFVGVLGLDRCPAPRGDLHEGPEMDPSD